MGILVAAASLLSAGEIPRILVAALFLVGCLLAVLSVFANNTQHTYYQASRNLKGDLEERLELKETALATTPGMGSKVARLGAVGTFLKTMLVAIALVDLLGAGISGHDALARATDERVVNLTVRMPAEGADARTLVAAAPQGSVVATRQVSGGRVTRPFSLQPGPYVLWADGTAICHKPVTVTNAALQIAVLDC